MASYGICCFRFAKDTEREVLILRRRYTYAYCAIIYGNYKTPNDIKKLLSGTTVDEKLTLLSLNFEMIWRRVFVGDDLTSEKYNRARDIFSDMLVGVGKESFKELTLNASNTDSQWELPKGRKDIYETDIECACREFCEETSINRDDYRIIISSDVKCFFRDGESLYHVKFWGAIIRNSEGPKISLLDNSYREHDVAKFVPITVARGILPKPFVRVVDILSRGTKKQSH